MKGNFNFTWNSSGSVVKDGSSVYLVLFLDGSCSKGNLGGNLSNVSRILGGNLSLTGAVCG